jgi:chromosome partitioning protein
MTNYKKATLVKNQKGSKARFMAFSTMKGGNLKTTSAVSIAGAILRENPDAKILLVDFDMQGNVFTSFNMNPDILDTTLTDVLLGDCKAEDAIYEAYQSKEGTGFINILPSNEDAGLMEMEIISNPKKYQNPLYRFKETCSHLVDYFDYLIIDTPPSYSLSVAMVLCFDASPVNEIYIPYHPELYSYRALLKAVQMIKKFQKTHNPRLEIKSVFPTKVDKRTNLHSVMIQTAIQFCMGEKINFSKVIIPHSIKSANAIAFEGIPGTLLESKNDIVTSYLELWEEIK